MKNILIISTSHAVMGNTGEATGLYLEELSTPYYTFVGAGYGVDIASIKGGKVPLTPSSDRGEDQNPESVNRFLRDKVAIEKLMNSIPVDSVDANKYEAIYFPGGHGTMWDFPNNPKLAKIISTALENDKIVAAICHGPAALVGVNNKDGEPIIKGKKVCCFTNDEEEAAKLTEAMPFLLQSKLEELGGIFQKADKFKSCAVADGNLITGQNPASIDELAKLILEKLGKGGVVSVSL